MAEDFLGTNCEEERELARGYEEERELDGRLRHAIWVVFRYFDFFFPF